MISEIDHIMKCKDFYEAYPISRSIFLREHMENYTVKLLHATNKLHVIHNDQDEVKQLLRHPLLSLGYQTKQTGGNIIFDNFEITEEMQHALNNFPAYLFSLGNEEDLYKYDSFAIKIHLCKGGVLAEYEEFLEQEKWNLLKGKSKDEVEPTPEYIGKELNDKLSLKQQVILLERLGFFDNKLVNHLNTEQKGKLIGHLLNRSEKNTTECVRNLNVPKKSVSKDDYFVKTNENLKKVNDLLKKLGLEKLAKL